MKWTQVIIILSLLTGIAYSQADSNSFSFNQHVPPLSVQHKGMFMGQTGGALIMGGGIESAGQLSKQVYVLPPQENSDWQSYELNTPVAFSAFLSAELKASEGTVKKLFVLGGLSEDGLTDAVQVLEWRENTLVQSKLPALPQALACAGAGLFQDQQLQQLVVVGGTTSPAAETAMTDVYRITLNDPEGPKWETLPPLPGDGRLFPSIVCFYNDVHVFGGFTPESQAEGIQYTPLASAYAYRWKPIDGTTNQGWRELATLPEAVAMAAVFQTGQVHAGVAGGIRTTIEAPLMGPDPLPEGTDAIHIYHNVTDTWVDKGRLPVLMSAPTAVPHNKTWRIGEPKTVYDMVLNRTVKSMTIWDCGVLFGYFISVAAFAMYVTRKQKSSEAYALADRKIAWWMAGISMFASGASSISLIAIPAQAFRTNLVWCFPIVMLIPLFFLEAYVIYPLIRKLNLTSTYEYLEQRFHPSLRYIASAQCIALQIFGRMNMVLLLPALAIAAVTGLNISTSVLLMGIVTTLYTTQGGLKAVIIVEFIQGITMVVGISAIIIMAITSLSGGVQDFVDISMEFDKFDYAIFSWDVTMPVFWLIILSPMLTKLAFASDQPVVQRVFATPLKDVRKLAGMFLFCSIFIAAAVNIAGISVFSYFRQNPQQLDPAMTNDQIIPLYIVQNIPSGLAGLIIASIFAAAASTLSSSMNSVATIFTEDFYRLARPKAADRERVVVMRVVTVVSGLIATGCALYMGQKNLRSLFQTWNELFALLGGGFLGIYILGIFTHRTSALGAATGALASIGITIYVKNFTVLHWYGYMPIAVFSCMLIGYVVSILIPTKSKDLSGLTIFDLKRDLS